MDETQRRRKSSHDAVWWSIGSMTWSKPSYENVCRRSRPQDALRTCSAETPNERAAYEIKENSLFRLNGLSSIWNRSARQQPSSSSLLGGEFQYRIRNEFESHLASKRELRPAN